MKTLITLFVLVLAGTASARAASTVAHKSGSLTIAPGEKVEIAVGKKLPATLTIGESEYFDGNSGKKSIWLKVDSKMVNKTATTMHVRYHLILLDKDDNLVAAHKGGSFADKGIEAGGDESGFGTLDVPRVLYPTIAKYKLVYYESDKVVGK